MNSLVTTLIIFGLVVLSISIIALLFFLVSQRKKIVLYKKVDYLIEDLTYKSEMLNSTVETVAKISNYIDVFEVVTKKNIKTVLKLYERNKDDIYKIAERIKKAAIGKETTVKKERGKK
ncbi:MAG: hypothetical protein DSZ21_00265 [Tenericutes bacterium]|nr:MAG: hypothetical protein DSZ21_00265 [Mycoplasmatota bacterium]